MDPLTHVAAGVALSQFVPSPSRPVAAGAAVLFALLPDVDYFLIHYDRLSYLKHHRGFSHSLFAVLLFALAGAVLARLFGGPRWARPMFLLGLVVLGSHLFLDWLTSYGTQLLNPLSRAKFALDWVFIFDLWLTSLFLFAAAAAWLPGSGPRLAAAGALVLAVLYILWCGFMHHQALELAHLIYQTGADRPRKVAAFPQPLSNRRWLLMGQDGGEIRQAFVELPLRLPKSFHPRITESLVSSGGHSPPRVPATTYRPAAAPEVLVWRAVSLPPLPLSPEARVKLQTYLDFCRFPLLVANEHQEDALTLTWVDLRFSVPGRPLPFGLTLRLDQGGRLLAHQVGGPRLYVGKGGVEGGRQER